MSKIINGDCVEYMKKIPDSCIDLILTDPPYNISQYSTGNIPLPGREALNNNIADWDNVPLEPKELLADFKRIIKPDGNIFVFTSYNLIGKWHEVFNPEFDTFQFFIWHKTNPAPKIYRNGFLNSCEMIICMWNKGHKWNFSKQNEMHNFFESPICMYPERLKNPKHPAQKPVKLLKHIINIASDPNDIVFDPFMGVGSTGVAALELGRRFAGCEIDKVYFEAAKKRIEKNYEKNELSCIHENMKELGLAALSHANRVDGANDKWAELSVLQVAHATEILVKARIAKEHPLLIFEKLPKITNDELSLENLFNDGHTIEWSSLPDLLWATTNII